MSEQLLSLLVDERVDEFNAARGHQRIDLFASELEGKSLVGVDLSAVHLEKSDMTGTDVSGAILNKANLSGIDGSGMCLRGAAGLRARFRGAWLDGSDLTEADLTQADFSEANLSGSAGTGAVVSGGRFREVDATGATWPDADLSESKMHESTWDDADLRRSDLTGTSARGVSFQRAKLDGVTASEARWPEGKLHAISLSGARLAHADLGGADLRDADLSSADLSWANLSGADLSGARLSNALLKGANLDDAKLEGARFEGADLTGLDPALIGMSDAEVATLAAFGVPYRDDAPTRLEDVSAAASGDVVALLWRNPSGVEVDGKPGEVLRWRISRADAQTEGVLCIPSETVVDHQVIEVDGGFLFLLARVRPEGASWVTIRVDENGAMARPEVRPMGYSPMGRPVVDHSGPTPWIWGLADRGPTLVGVDVLGDEGPSARATKEIKTAMEMAEGQATLLCKGEVLLPIQDRQAGAPRRAPEAFFASDVRAVAHDDGDLLAFWGQPPAPRRKGGLWTARIGRRRMEEPEPLSDALEVLSLSVGRANQPYVVWAEQAKNGQTHVRIHQPADDHTMELTNAGSDVLSVHACGTRLLVIDFQAHVTVFDADTGERVRAF